MASQSPAATYGIAKSFHAHADPIVKYCTEHSVRLDPLHKELCDASLAQCFRGLGAPEVLQLGQNFLHLIKAKRALDIGTLTGAFALAWALALPDDGLVISMDTNHTHLNNIGKPILEKKPDILKKIDFRLAPALETLDSLIASGEAGKFDFSFIDANNDAYPEYYEKSLTLLRSGGVILIDNALHRAEVLNLSNAGAKVTDVTNKLAHNDDRVWNSLLNLGDGTHVIFKK